MDAAVPRHRTIRLSTGVVVCVLVAAATGAATAAWMNRSSDDAPRVAETFTFDTAAPPPTVAVMPPVPPASAETTVALETTTSAATSVAVAAPALPVTSLQAVPAVRDLIVEIGGQRYSTDSAGAISVAGIDPTAVVAVIGVLADPPIQQVEFLGWADGTGPAPRTLQSLGGPVASLGLSLSSRVTVVLAADTVGAASVRFDSEEGASLVALGTPTWLRDQRAVLSDGVFTVQQLQYISRRVVTDQGAAPLAAQMFVATPEAHWVVGITG